MRHGEAQANAAEDCQRVLTAQGSREVKQIAAKLSDSYQPFDYIWVSPYVRTQETAALIKTTQQKAKLEIKPALVPEARAAELQTQVDLLLAEQPDARVLIISHMPLVSFLVEVFTQPGIMPIFGTATVCCIDYNPASGGTIIDTCSPAELYQLERHYI